MAIGTCGGGQSVQAHRKFLSGPCDARPERSRRCTHAMTSRPRSVKPRIGVCPSFGAIHRGWGLYGRAVAHDLRRVWTRTDSIRRRHKGVGPGGAGLDPHGRAARDGGRRRLRVRLDRPGRHRGGGGRRRRPPLPRPADSPALPDTDSHSHSHSHATATVTDPHPDAHSDPDAHRAAETDTETRPAAAPAGATSARRRGAATDPHSDAHPHPHADTHTDSRSEAEPAARGAPGDLSGVPRHGPPAATTRRPAAGHPRPAHHRARGARRRGAASALIPGGTPCRNGLFSSSRWRPPVSWSSS